MLLETLRRIVGENRPVVVAGLGGEAGSKMINDTSTVIGEFKAIVVLEETEFDVATVGNAEGLPGDTVAAGEIIHGLFTTIKLVSGKVRAYRC